MSLVEALKKHGFVKNNTGDYIRNRGPIRLELIQFNKQQQIYRLYKNQMHVCFIDSAERLDTVMDLLTEVRASA